MLEKSMKAYYDHGRRKDMKLLLTAFDPFGGDKVNPALEAVKLVPEKIGDVDVVKLEIPTVFRKSIDKVLEAMHKEKPDVVLCIGQAGGRFEITPERVAINVDDARIKDNEGNQPIGKIFKDGENAYFSSLPIKAIVQKIREAGLPSAVSNTAGTFVCNHIMYGVLYHIAKSFPGMRGGFIHVPFIPNQVVDRPAPAPCLSQTDIARGIEAAIKAIAETKVDVNVHEGTEH
jgi:pyroglutamyl-peptidase